MHIKHIPRAIKRRVVREAGSQCFGLFEAWHHFIMCDQQATCTCLPFLPVRCTTITPSTWDRLQRSLRRSRASSFPFFSCGDILLARCEDKDKDRDRDRDRRSRSRRCETSGSVDPFAGNGSVGLWNSLVDRRRDKEKKEKDRGEA